MYTLVRGALVGIITYYILDLAVPNGTLTIEIKKNMIISVIAAIVVSI